MEERDGEGRPGGSIMLTAAFYIGSLLSFLLAIYCLYYDHVAAGTVAAGLFVSSSLIARISDFEIFEAFGIKTRLKRTLNDAEILLEKLKNSTKAVSEISFLLLGVSDRFGEIGPIKKRSMVESLNGILQEIDISKKEIEAINRPYIYGIKLDLAWSFDHIWKREFEEMEREYQSIQNALVQNALASSPNPETATKEKRYREFITPIRAVKLNNIVDSTELARDYIANALSKIPIQDDRKERMISIARDVDRMLLECKEAGNYTVEAMEFITRNRPHLTKSNFTA